MSNPHPRSGLTGRKLEPEIQAWLSQGLISADQAAAIRAQYHDKPKMSLFTGFLFGFAAFLIGGGVIAFIAANWEGIPDLLKVIGGLVLMVFFQAVGYSWRTGDRPAAGNGLLILGALMFGANIGLFGQIFAAQAAWASGFGMWALGCTMLAYSAGSIPVMYIALIASSTAFFTGISEERILWPYSFLVGLQALPFAMRHRSRALFFFGLNLLTLGQITAVTLQNTTEVAIVTALICGLAMIVTSVILLHDTALHRLGRVAQVLGVLWIVGTLSIVSIGPITGLFIARYHSLMFHREFAPLLTGLYAVYCIIMLGPILRRNLRYGDLFPLLFTAFGIIVANTAAILAQQPEAAYFVSLASYFAMSILCVWFGLTRRDRTLYSIGTLAIGLRLLVFFVIFDVPLGIKALLFVVGGVAVLVVALQYERWAKQVDAAEGLVS